MAEILTQDKILDVAQELCQRRGFNAFSYRDIGKALGIKNASIHYHFATKEDLGRALLQRYRERFAEQLVEIERRGATPQQQLQALVVALSGLLEGEPRMCLCGMMAADHGTLPSALQSEVAEFFAAIERWIEERAEQGVQAGELRLSDTPKAISRAMIASLQGMLLCARVFGDRARFEESSRWLMKSALGVESRI